MKTIFFLISLIIILTSCKDKNIKIKNDSLTIYSSRKGKLSKPLFELFEKKTKIKLNIKTGKSTNLSNLILIENKYSPADIIFSQDVSNLNSLAKKGLLSPLPKKLTQNVFQQFKSQKNLWVGTSGRARVFVYNSSKIKPHQLPHSLNDLTHKKWYGKLGWAPLNGSFQSHISALRKIWGEKQTKKWLLEMKINKIKSYPKNTPIIKAIITGQIVGGLVNHYYLYKIQKDSKNAQHIKNHYLPDPNSSLVNISGVAIIKSSKKKKLAQSFVEFLLTKEAQEIFTTQNFEYPCVKSIIIDTTILKPISSIALPNINLSEINDIKKTINILRETKIIN